MNSCRTRDQRGQVIVIFALMVPVFLGLGAIVIGIGNWYTHAKHLQTKADAGAFAGGGVWSFPCVEGGTQGSSSQTIVDAARLYVGPHVQADGTPYVGSTFNPQVGNVPGSDIHVVLNGSDWYDDDSNPFPVELDDPPNPSICNSMTLDVKVTEDNSFPLFSLLPLFPDIKRKARVQIEQVEGVTGLLPIAVRVPKPLSMAAVFYNESNGQILAAKYVCESSGAIVGLPAGLGGWTSLDTGVTPNPLCTSWASFTVPPTAGVAIATSTRPACDAPNPPTPPGNWGLCMDDNPPGVSTVNDFCRQSGAGGTIQCFYATGSSSSQTVHSGLQFIRGFDGTTVVGNGPPVVRSAWFDGAGPNCGNYFSITSGTCSATLNADIDFGDALNLTLHPGAAADVKYGLVYGTTGPNGDTCLDGQNRPNCDMAGSWTANVTFDPRFDNQGDPDAVRHAVAIRVRLKDTTIGPPGPGQINCGNNFSATCQWFFTANGGQTTWPAQAAAVRQLVFDNPVQRSFTGDDNISGPIKWLRLHSGTGGGCTPQYDDGQAASQPTGQACFYIELGLKGALASDQDEPAFAFNFKGSQSGSVDCDDGYPNWRTEVENTCRPYYSANDFTRLPPTGPCPWPSGSQVSWNTFMSPPAPYDTEWPPYTCLRTDGPPAPGQVEQGLKARLFNNQNQNSCPTDSATDFVQGRNYWDDGNNASGGTYAFADLGVHGNNLKPPEEDKRLVMLFLTSYDSFGGSGGDVFPIVGFANFYITGFGKITGGGGLQIDDPCPGNDPPPDLVVNSGLSGAQVVWGHFVNAVTPGPFTTGGNGELCAPGQSFQPCVAVLVE